jgi:hypothetical protein
MTERKDNYDTASEMANWAHDLNADQELAAAQVFAILSVADAIRAAGESVRALSEAIEAVYPAPELPAQQS